MTAVLVAMFLPASTKVATSAVHSCRLRLRMPRFPRRRRRPAIDSQLPQQRETRVLALSTALGGRVVWDRLLREVSQVLPSDVWITTLSATARRSP